jgi:O-antigen/teichoic acid export membrane protein
MASTKRFAFNVVMNWIAMAVGMVVPFFLTPFVVKSLGPTAYGVWILAVSTVSYLNLLDLGMRSAIIRFVSKAESQSKVEDAKNAIRTALWFRILIAAGVGVISVGLAVVFPHMFKVPADLHHAGRVTVLFCALGVAITLISGVYGAVLASINRFDVLSTISMLQTVARAGGVLLILRSGHGLVSLAYWEFTTILLGGVATTCIALKIFPNCRVRVMRPNMETLRMLASYSVTTFIWMIAVQIIINTDNMVIGAFLSVGVVSFYSIGGSLIAYSGQVVSSMSTTFTPLASGLEASSRFAELRKLLIRGTQASLAISLPISLTLLLRGKTFIGLWMGPQYSEISGTVLQILIIAQISSVTTNTAGSIMMAIGKHKPVALWTVVEASVNLGLSIVLVKTIGIYGVAWGTSISNALLNLLFWPRYIRKVLGVSERTFLLDGCAKVMLCSIPFGIACVLADRYWHAANLAVYFSQVLATLPIYAICVLIMFRSEARSLFERWRASRPTNTVVANRL